MTLRWLALVLLGLAPACAQDIAVLDAGVEGADAAPGSTDAAAPPDASGGRDGAAEPDSGPRDAEPTAVDAAAADAGGLACLGDPFVPCDDPEEAGDPNDTWSDATYFNDNHSVGCLTADDLTPLDRTRTGRVCPREQADFYQQILVGCDTRTMFVELRLHVLTPCDPADWTLSFLSGGGRVACDSGRHQIQCLEENGDKVVRLRVDPVGSVISWQFAIETLRPDLLLDYELTMTLN